MMHLFSSVKKHPLYFVQLSTPGEAKLVASWFTEEWGYLYDPPSRTKEESVEIRKNSMFQNRNRIYLAYLGNQPVGAFRVEPKDFCEELKDITPKTSEIYFVYVDKKVRNLGFGRQIIQQIKAFAQTNMQADQVILETLKPGLNLMYQKAGAKLLFSNSLEGHPTDMLSMDLHANPASLREYKAL